MRRRQIVIGPDTKLVRVSGRPPSVVITLLAVQLGLFLLYAFADGPRWVARHVALSAGQALGMFEGWQPLTAIWIHLHTRDMIVNLLALWFFGSPLARWWGTRRFVLFWLATAVGGMLLALLVGLLWPAHVVSGSAGAAAAMMLAFSVVFADHLVFFYGVLPLRGRWIALLMLGFAVIGNLVATEFLQVALQAGGLLVAVLFLFKLRRLFGKLRLSRSKRKLGVIEGGRKQEPRYWN